MGKIKAERRFFEPSEGESRRPRWRDTKRTYHVQPYNPGPTLVPRYCLASSHNPHIVDTNILYGLWVLQQTVDGTDSTPYCPDAKYGYFSNTTVTPLVTPVCAYSTVDIVDIDIWDLTFAAKREEMLILLHFLNNHVSTNRYGNTQGNSQPVISLLCGKQVVKRRV